MRVRRDSSTLTNADWAETRIARGELPEDIDRPKREPGGPVLLHGVATFIHSLVHAGLIDEYRLVIHPVAIGHGTGTGTGTGMFDSLSKPVRLDLVEARAYPSGTAVHVYRYRPETADLEGRGRASSRPCRCAEGDRQAST